MRKLVRNRFLTWSISVVALACLAILAGQDVQAQTSPPQSTRELMGVTPTPTFTVTSTPTSTATPVPTATAPAPTATPTTGDSDRSDVTKVDPVIVKHGEPSDALPGEAVDFSLQVSNQGTDAAVDVVITDEVPEQFEILSVETTQGVMTIRGQTVTVEVGVVGPGFVVDIVIHTRVREDVDPPVQVENLAILTAANSGERTASDTITILDVSLPVTGFSDESVLTLVIAAAGVALLVLFGLWEGNPLRQGRQR
jgi:uncharacterized repeat protein (TIGR01451 family)